MSISGVATSTSTTIGQAPRTGFAASGTADSVSSTTGTLSLSHVFAISGTAVSVSSTHYVSGAAVVSGHERFYRRPQLLGAVRFDNYPGNTPVDIPISGPGRFA
jgi:hypothetical protein